MTKQSERRSGESTENERAAAVAVLAAHIDVLGQAKRDGDDDLWDDIANDGIDVVLGGTTWDVMLASDGWTASRPTHGREMGAAAFGEGDLIGTVGPASLSPEEIVRRLDTLEFDAFRDN